MVVSSGSILQEDLVTKADEDVIVIMTVAAVVEQLKTCSNAFELQAFVIVA